MFLTKTSEVGYKHHSSDHSRFWTIIAYGMVMLVSLAGCRYSATAIPGVPTNLPVSETAQQPVSSLVSEGTALPGTNFPSAATITSSPIAQGSVQDTPSPFITPTIIPTPASTTTAGTGDSLLEIPEPMIGVETHSMKPAVLSPLQAAGIHWTRRNALFWSVVEPVEGQLHWERLASLENDLVNASSQGISTILIVGNTPLWAQKVNGHACGPVREDKLLAFASFMKDLVARYSVPPYNVTYWEIGNEPDVDPSLVPADSLFGCWGDQNDPYYGGGYYAKMLKAVYPAIKSADPEAMVLNGGLLLDCDPTHPPQGKDCKPSLFFKGMVEGGGANYLDIVSFHGYANYNGSWKTVETSGNWEARGGNVLGKVSYLREVMNAYAVDKPIFNTEGSLNCPESNVSLCKPPTDQFFETQADYAVTLYLRNWAAGIAGTVWYDFEGPGWRNGSMLNSLQKPKPDYNALMFLLRELKGAFYRREVKYYENVQIYEFSLPEKRVWVLWPTDDNAHQIIPPGNTLNIYDKYGNALTPTKSVINLTGPVYFELQPKDP